MADRHQLGLVSASDDRARLKLQALKFIGAMPMEDVRPRHLRDMVLEMRKDAVLAPRTIRKIYATVVTMFRTAVADELIPFSPCVLARGILPKNVDGDPSFRANAIFTREEVETLISDVRLLEDRRVVYALKVLAGLRHGEASGLRWRQCDRTLEPRVNHLRERRVDGHATRNLRLRPFEIDRTGSRNWGRKNRPLRRAFSTENRDRLLPVLLPLSETGVTVGGRPATPPGH